MSREKVYVVDKNDAILEEKWRDELTDRDCWRIIAVWVENSAGEILIQQRSYNKKLNPGLWTAGVIGTVTTSESYEEAAYKELSEELGTSGITLTLRKKAHYKASVGFRNITTYGCTIDKPASEFIIPDLWDVVYGFKAS